MDFLSENTSIGKLVAKIPEYANVFEKLELDYCCKGNRTLKEACEEKKLNAVEVLETLKQLSTPNVSMNWDCMTLKQIILYIIDTYHTPLKQELHKITQLIEKLKNKHERLYSYISDLQNVFEQMKNSLLEHMQEEEQIVFPIMINIEINKKSQYEKLKKYLNHLDNDHLQTGEDLERIKNLTDHYIPSSDACMTHIIILNSLKRLERNLHEHIHKENQILFPRVKVMFQ